MQEYDASVYTDEDLETYFSLPHINVVATNEDGRVLAFACILVLEEGYKMCYTYSTKDGKKAYVKGIDYMVARYNPMYFGEGALKFNKIRRLFNDTESD